MIQYKNGRLHIPGISFAVPEGFFFNTSLDSVTDNCLCFIAPDESYSLILQSTSADRSTARELETMIEYTGAQLIKTPSPTTVNGLKGHYAVYSGGDEVYYEYRLQNPYRKGEYAHFVLLIICNANRDILAISESETVRQIIANIRPEPISK